MKIKCCSKMLVYVIIILFVNVVILPSINGNILEETALKIETVQIKELNTGKTLITDNEKFFDTQSASIWKTIDLVHHSGEEELFSNIQNYADDYSEVGHVNVSGAIIDYTYLNDYELLISFELQSLIQTIVENEYGVFTLLNIPTGSYIREIGKPQLPCITQFVALPTSEYFLEIISTNIKESRPISRMYPVQEPHVDSEVLDFFDDEVQNNLDQNYPGENAEILEEGNVRDVSFVSIRFNPIQYNPYTEIATIYDKITIKITCNKNQVFFTEHDLENSLFKNFYHNIFDNWEDFIQNIAFGRSLPKGTYDAVGCEYLIITHPDFLEAAIDLAEWKNRRGIITKVVNTSMIGDDSTSIKQYIQVAYDTWSPPPAYVLLVGDAEYVPTNYDYVHPYYDPPIYTGTDLWYATVDGSDYYPDIFIGRIPVDTLSQATTVVHQILGYEQTPPSTSGFFENITVAAYFQDDDSDGYEDRRFVRTSEEVRDYLLMEGYDVERIYNTYSWVNPTNYNNGPYGNGEPLPPDLLRSSGFAWNGDDIDITNAINSGAFIMNHRDHGARGGWDRPPYDVSNILNDLDNNDLLPIVFSVNCNTGWFDAETDIEQDGDPVVWTSSECFCEEFIKKINGGCIGIVGASRVSYSGYNDFLCRGFFDAVWPDFDQTEGGSIPLYRMGEVLNYGKSYMANTWGGWRLEFELFHWFGDTTLELWTDMPVGFTVAYPSIISIGTSSFIVHVEDEGGEAVDQAYVVLWKDDEVYMRGYTDSNGDVIFTPDPATEGIMYVTVTKHNYIPFLGETQVIAGEVVIPFSIGWNLNTIPVENSYSASTLAENISGCEVISRWDALQQTYRSFIVGGPPGLDYSIEDGCGYFFLVNETSELSLIAIPISSINIRLSIGWNMIGWYHEYNTTASSLGGAISGCEVISRWDAMNQTYRSYIIGGPPGLDFTITRGMGLFILVNEESLWYGEG